MKVKGNCLFFNLYVFILLGRRTLFNRSSSLVQKLEIENVGIDVFRKSNENIDHKSTINVLKSARQSR